MNEPIMDKRTLDQLSGAEKRAMLARLLRERAARSRPNIFPLTFAQERVWFLDRLSPGNLAYNIPSVIELEGQLDIAALIGALNLIVERHEALRTTFTLHQGSPMQRITPAVRVSVPVVDLTSLPVAAREGLAKRLAAASVRTPFDLTRGPLIRGHLLKLAERRHVLALTLHHIISDGWSIGILVREFADIYGASQSGESCALPALQLQYGDYAAWQRRWLTGEVLDRLLGYWRRCLGEEISALELPTDRPRPAVQTHRGGSCPLRFSPALTQDLKRFSQQAGTTLFMALLTLFQVLLHRLSGQSDLSVGTPIANRHHSRVEPLIGFFANTLVLRTELAGAVSLGDLIARVSKACLEAYDHQEMPFEKLVAELKPQRDPSHNPLFQVMFVLLNTPFPTLELPDLELRLQRVDSQAARFDLTLTFVEDEGALSGSLEYNADLFDASTIARFGQRLEILMQGALGGLDSPLTELPILGAGERQQLLQEWNDSTTLAPAGLLHEVLEDRARKTPDAIAVEDARAQVSCVELDRRATLLACYLRGLGVEPEVLVGIALEPSIERVVALLAVLKAGGAYVPLDLAHPAARLAGVLEDSAAAVLLTRSIFAEQLPEGSARRIFLDLDLDLERFEGSESASLPSLSDHNLAYVIFTSGSTGRPKGVQISHAAATAFLAGTLDRLGLDEETRLLAVTTLAFDIALLELFAPLMAGGRVVIASRQVARDGYRLASALANFTHLQATPATWRLLVEVGWRGHDGFQALCGGEALECQLAGELLARCGAVWNLYGPTETTVWSSMHRVRSSARSIPLGKPLVGERVYVSDLGGEPLPIGVVGELVIAGEGLARGYRGRPGWTAERFVPNPWGPSPGARLYRTGDQARRLVDGSIEYLGRKDHQVKVRGFRIELGEIEAALHRHPSIAAAVVTSHQASGGEDRLVAYFVVGADSLEVEALRDFLKGVLPDYMVPARLVRLPELPLTPNGKVDRGRLTEFAEIAPARRGLGPPTSRIERRIVEIWCQALEIPELGLDDNFFDHGAHSLLLVRVHGSLEQEFGREIPLVELFRHPTVRTLARHLERPANPPVSPVSPGASRRLSDGKHRLGRLRRRQRSRSGVKAS